MTATAYERIVAALRSQGKKVKESKSGNSAKAQCPVMDHRQTSLGVYDKDGRAKVVCYAGCNAVLDILPALDLTVAALYDEPKQRGTGMSYQQVRRLAGVKTEAERRIEARIEARRTMSAPLRQLDDLIHLPDIGTRLVLAIAQIRPELYFAVKHDLDIGSNKVLLADLCGKHVAHLMGGAQ
jgi:hypothetical protein